MFIKRSYKDHFIHYSTHRSKKQVFFGRCVKQLFAFYGDPYFRMIVFIRCPFGVFCRVVTELYAPACCNTGIHSENSKAKYSHAPKRPTLFHRRRFDPRYSPPPFLSVPVTVHDEMSSSSDASTANEVAVPSAVMSIVIMHKRTATDNVFFNLIPPCFHLPLISHKCVRL